jgi:hypothetical protein
VCQSNIESLSYIYQISGYTSVGCIFLMFAILSCHCCQLWPANSAII